jgi:hypothetical protein
MRWSWVLLATVLAGARPEGGNPVEVRWLDATVPGAAGTVELIRSVVCSDHADLKRC